MTCAHGCNGTGRLGADQERPCPCAREQVADALDRVTAEKLEVLRTATELGRTVEVLEGEKARALATVAQLEGTVAAQARKLELVFELLDDRAAALASALNHPAAVALRRFKEHVLQQLAEVDRG